MITALIVDDEPLARARLRRLLEEQGVKRVEEAENAAAAIEQAEDLRPDILFLDIEMPGLSGMQLAYALMYLSNAPLLVFVTGYSGYALAAFEQGALDYLVKPIAAERLALTLVRVHERLTDRHSRIAVQQRALPEIEKATSPLRSLPIRAEFAVRFLPLSEILCIVAHDKKVFAVTAEGEQRTLYTLSQLETLLPSDRFLRIHDSSLVNLDAIVELLFLGDHNYEVRLTNRQRIRVGRTHYAELQRRLGLDHRPTA